MAALCPRAEEIIQERKIALRPSSRQKLATYDPATQVQWLVNPKIQFLIERTTNELLTKSNHGGYSQQVSVVKPPDVKPPEPDPEPDLDEPVIFGLFGDDDDY